MSKVGIVILNYNDYETTRKYIEEIKDYKVLNKIIIVDKYNVLIRKLAHITEYFILAFLVIIELSLNQSLMVPVSVM